MKIYFALRKKIFQPIFCVQETGQTLSVSLYWNSSMPLIGSKLQKENDVQLSRIQTVLAAFPNCEVIYLIPRGQVLQKPFKRQGPFPRTAQESLIQKLLPYSGSEMIHELSLFQRKSETMGRLVAIARQTIETKLKNVANKGLMPTEVVVEDDVVVAGLCASFSKLPDGYWLVNMSVGMLFLQIKNNFLVTSKIICGGVCIQAKSIIQMLQVKGSDEQRIHVLGYAPSPELDMLKAKLDNLHDVHVHTIPLSEVIVQGVRSALKTKLIPSLLPGALKTNRRQHCVRQKCKWAVGTVISVLVCLYLWGELLVHMRSTDIVRVQREYLVLQNESQDVEEKARQLHLLNEAEQSKQSVLKLLKGLSANLSSGINLKGIEIEKDTILVQAESVSHSEMAESVEILEGLDNLHEMQLAQTRLRTRLNRDYFDYEVSGRWEI